MVEVNHEFAPLARAGQSALRSDQDALPVDSVEIFLFQPGVIWFRGASMEPKRPPPMHYKRARFATHLPAEYLYSPSHFWVAAQEEAGIWRVGMTKFASRMLGELVDHGFSVEPGGAVASGQIIGWIEGFKAISDLFCIAEGEFAGANPALKEDPALISKDSYKAGWLYAVRGKPDPKCVDVNGYAQLLDKTIDHILAKEKGED
jgi:glycine cleavage system H protein